MLVNTSYDLHGYPITRDPREALSIFNNSGLQYLTLGDHLLMALVKSFGRGLRSSICYATKACVNEDQDHELSPDPHDFQLLERSTPESTFMRLDIYPKHTGGVMSWMRR